MCTLFIYETMFTIGESQAISHSVDTEQEAQKVAGNPRFSIETPTKIHREQRRRRQREAGRKAKRTSFSTRKVTSSTQWPQTSTEAVTKYYNNTANETNEEREHQLPTLQKAMGRSGNAYSYSKIIFFDAMIGSNSYTICTKHIKNIFPTEWGECYQPLHHEQHWALQKLYFTMNRLFITTIMSDM